LAMIHHNFSDVRPEFYEGMKLLHGKQSKSF
jgi:hypothetical protein